MSGIRSDSLRLHVVRRPGLSAACFNNTITVQFISEGFEIMELCGRLATWPASIPVHTEMATLSKSLVNCDDEVVDVLISSLFSSYLE